MPDLNPQPPVPLSNPHQADSGSWSETARQLRAIRDEQQRTWGDLDSSTLGRYLADEVDPAERARIEAEMQTHPELAKLTDLVRDILADFSPDEMATPSVPAPAILAPQPDAGTEPSSEVISLAFAPRKPRAGLLARNRHYIALAAAACLLLVLGRGLFDLPPKRGTDSTVAFLVPPPAVVDNPIPAGTFATASLKPLEQLDQQLARDQAADQTPPDALVLEAAYRRLGQKNALEKHPRFAASLNNLGVLLKDQGHLARAEQTFQQSYNILNEQCGKDNPQTRLAASNLAEVYQMAFNSNPDLFGSPYASEVTSSTPVQASALLKGQEPIAAPPAPYTVAGGQSLGAARAGDRDALRFHELREMQHKLGAQPPEKVRGSVVPVLAQALRHATTKESRLALMRALTRVGPTARDVTPLLLERLHSTDSEEQRGAIQALGSVGPGVPGVVRVLVDIVVQSPDLAADAGRSLLALGPDGRLAIEQLSPEAVAFRKQATDLKRDKNKVEAAKAFEARADVLDRLQQLAGESRWRTGVLDAACLFTPHALMTTHHQIERLRQSPASQVYIETLRKAPAGEINVNERARLLGTGGLYVLLIAEQPGVHLHVGEALRKAGFTEDNERDLKQNLERLRAARKFDLIPPCILGAIPTGPRSSQIIGD